jgi:hypothetical protein
MPSTLTISWSATTPAPSLGYRVKYWPVSNPTNISEVTPYPTGTSTTITGLTEVSYGGTVEGACGAGNFSSPQSFSASIAGASASLQALTCSNGIGTYRITGTAGDVVKLRLTVGGYMQNITGNSWLGIILGSTNPSFSAAATSSCYTANGGVNLVLNKNITIPVGGIVNLSTSCFVNNGSASAMSAALTIVSVNGGANTSSGTTTINGVCVYNSSTGGSCPGATNTGD